jgi:addiction module RelB/DinJ family antitoxin
MIKTENKTATIQFRIEPKIKEKAAKIFKKNNMDMSLAISAMLMEVIKRGSPIVEMRTVNGFTPEREREILENLKNWKLSPSYSNAEDFLNALEK